MEVTKEQERKCNNFLKVVDCVIYFASQEKRIAVETLSCGELGDRVASEVTQESLSNRRRSVTIEEKRSHKLS